MDMLKALSLSFEENTLVSLVGGGGKTSTMFRLASELKYIGKKVLVTTTTAIYYPEKSLYNNIYLWDSFETLDISALKPEPATITVIGSYITEEGKLKGIPKELVDILHKNLVFDSIIVEADGAKGRPIKAPDKHEPVIPENTTIYIGVIGIDSYEKSIDNLWALHPHLLAEVVGKTVGDCIDIQVITKLALSGEGLFKNCPTLAEKVLLINKVEGDEQILIAKQIGDAILLSGSDIKKILIGSVQSKNPIEFVMGRVVR